MPSATSTDDKERQMTTADIPTPLYQLLDVTKAYGEGATRVSAVRDVSLTIESGEFLVVVGPSGSGKTTLLQLLGALDRPSSGAILFEGSDLARLKEAELTSLRLGTVGFIFQQFNLIPTLSAAENVELALAPRRVDRVERRKRLDELLETVGLSARGHHLPSELSGGEQQRVAIARALVNEPRVLLADEPTGNLDSATGEEIVKLLRRLSEERGQTVVLVTHDTDVASSSPRTIQMLDGAVVDQSSATSRLLKIQ
jgi:putative ABC transport system ATP-binding protein